jgi:hypothetical protein
MEKSSSEIVRSDLATFCLGKFKEQIVIGLGLTARQKLQSSVYAEAWLW